MINGISLEKQISWISHALNFEYDNFNSDDLEYLEAIQKTLEAEQKRRATNVLLNGGRK